jgi:hypothetical protein
MNDTMPITSTCWLHPTRVSSADFESVCEECADQAWAWARQVGLAGHGGWLYAWLRDVAGVVQPPATATPDDATP